MLIVTLVDARTHPQQYDAIQMKKDLERLRAANEEQRTQYKRRLAEEKEKTESARKRQRKLEEQNEELKKRLESADKPNFANFCTKNQPGTPRAMMMSPATKAAVQESATVVSSPLRSRSNSLNPSTIPDAKLMSTLSQFIP